MRLDPWFLSLPVEIWQLDSSFNEAKLTVSNLMVVNDAAERGVKLCHDYTKSSKQEGVLQNILQVVEKVLVLKHGSILARQIRYRPTG